MYQYQRTAAQEENDQSMSLLFFAVCFLGALITIASLIYPVTAIITVLVYVLSIVGLHKALIATFPVSDPHQLFTYAIFAALIPALIVGSQMLNLEKRLANNWLFWAFRHCWRLIACATWVFFLFGALRGDITMASFMDAIKAVGLAPFELFNGSFNNQWDVLAQLMVGLKVTAAMGWNMLQLIGKDFSAMQSGAQPKWSIEALWALGTIVVLHFMLYFSWRRRRAAELRFA